MWVCGLLFVATALSVFYTSVENAALAGVKNAPIRAVLHER
jgi:hypothetical protein